MKALKCDVCGGYFEGIETINGLPENKKPNRLRIYYQAYSGNTKKYVEIDICPECLAAVMTTLNDRKVVEIKKEGRHD